MRSAATFLLALLALLCMGTSGCEQPDVPMPPLSHHGVHVSMGVDGQAVPCGGTIPWMDRHVELLGELFGRSVEGLEVQYYWLRFESLRPGCDVACAYGFEITSTTSLIEHELVHAVVEQWAGEAEVFFSEGVAMAAGSRIYGSYETNEFDQLREMIGADRTIEVDYPTAGAFVTYLIEKWGGPTFFEFYDRTGPKSTYAGVAAAFEDVYGVSLDDSIADFRSEGPGCLLLLAECTLEPEPWLGELWETVVTLDCAQDSLGPSGSPEVDGEGRSWTYVTVDVPEAGNYLVSSDLKTVFFHPCGPCSQRSESVASSSLGEPGLEASLLPGRYVARVESFPGVPLETTLAIEPAP